MRLRALATAALTAGLLVGTAGCGVLLEPETLRSYAPSDGVNAEVGDVSIRNVLVVTNDVGDAAVVATLVNKGDSLVFVTVELQGDKALSTTIGAYPGFTKIGIPEDNPLVFTGAGVAAGSYVDVYFQYGNFEGALASVPVLDGHLEIYAPYAPADAETE